MRKSTATGCLEKTISMLTENFYQAAEPMTHTWDTPLNQLQDSQKDNVEVQTEFYQ